MELVRSWKYPNITIFIFSLFTAFIISRSSFFHDLLLSLGNFGYLGAFIAGALFVSSFTMAAGAVILFSLAKELSPIEVGLIAGVGAVLGDLIIFRFIKDNLFEEINSLYHHTGGKPLSHYFHLGLSSKYFHWKWLLPVLGAVIIASPFPDEAGVVLMGLSKINIYQFILISFTLNTLGIFLIISAAIL